MRGSTVTSTRGAASIVDCTSPKGSPTTTSSGPTRMMPRRSVGSRYDASETVPSSSGGTSSSAPVVPVTASRSRSTGVVVGRRLRTRSSTRLGWPACTRAGCTRPVDVESSRVRRT